MRHEATVCQSTKTGAEPPVVGLPNSTLHDRRLLKPQTRMRRGHCTVGYEYCVSLPCTALQG